MRKLLRYGVFTVLLFGAIGYGQSSDHGVANSSASERAKPTSTTSSTKTTNSAIIPTFGNGTCASRTANYITHTLPQQCLRTDRVSSAWNTTATAIGQTSTEATGSPISSEDATLASNAAVDREAKASVPGNTATSTGEPIGSATTDTPVTAGSTTVSQDEEESDSPLDNANFLSFEEWKKQNMAKVDSDQARNVPLNGDRQRPGINNALDSLGEEGEIDLDFSGFGGSPSGPSQPRAAYRQPDGASSQDAPTSQAVLSKDAGKTCKERTNYASFDCAAQVLKHNPECKSPSSVLVENKDSYMLNTCSAQNKFFVIELCNDVLVDTIVLANYEFFSSIFRQFRVSVSDRYPVKMDKWRELGTFEARNTREVQAFLVEHPQIWARYLRVEFLTHYGSEYYCPVSLLRVHGTNMLEDLRPRDDSGQGESGEDEAILEQETASETIIPPDPVASTSETEQDATHQTEIAKSVSSQGDTDTSSNIAESASSEKAASSTTTSYDHLSQNASTSLPTLPGPDLGEMTCSPNLTSVATEGSHLGESSLLNATQPNAVSEAPTSSSSQDIKLPTSRDGESDQSSSTTSSGSTNVEHTSSTTEVPSEETTESHTTAQNSTEANSTAQSGLTNTTSPSVDTATSTSISSTSISRTALSTSSASIAHPPQPSTQESFFKSLSKRLQQLESNSTLSLQYIEEQSRILRDAFAKVEKRQISSTSNFLTNLNETVVKELHGFRQAYDQLWQSTVLELESQREQYQREMLALGSRLTLVADELLWQKRMGIIQSTLLFLCLGLVLFARTGLQGYLEVPIMQQMMNKSSAALNRTGWESPPASPSPESRSPVALFRRKLWRSATEPSTVTNDGDMTGTDSRPDTRDGPNVDVFVEPPTPPTPPSSRGRESETAEVYDDADADDEEDVIDPRVSQSGPSTPTGTRQAINRAPAFVNGVIENGVG